jgi:hypothetical protein
MQLLYGLTVKLTLTRIQKKIVPIVPIVPPIRNVASGLILLQRKTGVMYSNDKTYSVFYRCSDI